MADDVHFADGIDIPERVAFGLGAAQLAVVCGGMLAAYALARSGLPTGLATPLAVSVAVLGAGLGWVHIAGRPALDWALFAVRYLVRPREGSLFVAVEAGSAAGRDHPRLARDATARHGRRVLFFSLKGGVGRTTLSVEVAAWLAARGQVEGAALRVALIDLDSRSPSVALRMGIPQPSEPRDDDTAEARVRPLPRVMHRCGAQVVLGLLTVAPAEQGDRLADVLADLDHDRFDVVVVDAGTGTPGAEAALAHVDDAILVITPTVTGVGDAYRAARALRAAGLRDRMSCVVNRARRGVDLSETIADLGLRLIAEVPDDSALVEAEDRHELLAVDGASPAAAAIRAIGGYLLARVLAR